MTDYATVNPATGETVKEFETLDAQGVETALARVASGFTEWRRTDISFERRISDLLSPAGVQGANTTTSLNKKTVDSDTSADTLTGGSPTALDWFLITLKQDSYTPHNPMDHITTL